jgi:hypothetical protein
MSKFHFWMLIAMKKCSWSHNKVWKNLPTFKLFVNYWNPFMDCGNHFKHDTKALIHLCFLKVSKGLHQTPTSMSNIISGKFIILVIYVDDGIIVNNKLNLIHYIIFTLKEEFEIINVYVFYYYNCNISQL